MENDIINYKYQIMKLNEKIPVLEMRLESLERKIHRKNEKRLQKEQKEQKEQEQKEQKELLFKKLYVELNDIELDQMKRVFGLEHFGKENAIKYLIDHNSTSQINEILFLFRVLSVSELNNFKHNIENNNISINDAIKKYSNRCRILKKLRQKYKNKIMEVEEECDVSFDGYSKECFNFVTIVKGAYDEFYWDQLSSNRQEDFILEIYGDYDYDYDLDNVLREIPTSELQEFYVEEKKEEIDEVVNGMFPFSFDVTKRVKYKPKKSPIKPKPKRFKNIRGKLYIDRGYTKLSIGDCNEIIQLIDLNGEPPSVYELLREYPNTSKKYIDIIIENYDDEELLNLLRE